MLFKTIVATALMVASSSMAQECTSYTQPQLCGSANHVINLEQCNDTSIVIPDFEPCCRLHTEQPQKCDDPEATQSCRSVVLSNGICPCTDDVSCCFPREKTMKLYLEFETSNKTCCSKCRCYGDPHCESFDGSADTWVICDARTPMRNNPSRCPVEKATCLAQLDHHGVPCNWTKVGNEAWNIGMLGSPCVPTNTFPPPTMVFYEAKDFKIVLTMGERSVIKDIIIDDKAQTYVLNAELCFQAAYAPEPENPWRPSFPTSPNAPNMPASWLPYKWTWGPLDGEDILWSISELGSNIDITIRCTRTVEITNGRRRYGPPRLNIDIVEPYNWQDNDQRPDVGGFCAKGIIDKQGSHEHTDRILELNQCTNQVDELEVAQLLCGAGTTNAGINGCKLRWCTTPTNNSPPRSSIEVQQCMSDIQQYGWDVTYCAVKSMDNAATASQCSGNPICRQCINDIADFGWAAAIAKWDGGLEVSNDCVTRADLPPDLLGFCTKGVRVQYFNSALNDWVTQFAIPADTCLVGGFVNLTPELDAPLFENPIRIIQCSEPKGACLTNKCATEVGFKAHIEFAVSTSPFERVYNLWQAGLLICDPKIWAGPEDCLGFVPEKMCPCPDRRRLGDGN